MINNRIISFLFIDNIKPICLPTTQEVQSLNLVGKKSVVAGWGSTSFGKLFNFHLFVRDCKKRL